MTDKVVSLRGDPVPERGKPSEEVMAFAKDILERAEAGEIVSIAACFGYADDAFSGKYAGPAESYGMIGVMTHLLHRLNASMSEGED